MNKDNKNCHARGVGHGIGFTGKCIDCGENVMIKKKIIPFDWDLYQKGAKAIFFNKPEYEIANIVKSKYDQNDDLIFSITYYEDDKKINHDWYHGHEISTCHKGHLMLETEVEEKVFWVNVYKNFHYAQAITKYLSFEEAKKNRDEDSLGSLKITYTDEDLIK